MIGYYIMKSTDLQNKTPKELTNLLQEHKIQLAKLGFELEASTLKDTSQIKKTKKEIARILTLLNKNANDANLYANNTNSSR